MINTTTLSKAEYLIENYISSLLNVKDGAFTFVQSGVCLSLQNQVKPYFILFLIYYNNILIITFLLCFF